MTNEILASVIGASATLLATVVAFILSTRYNNNNEELEHHRMMKELFKEFNKRFDKINNQLLVITQLSEGELAGLDKKTRRRYEGIIMDFFNICSEEFFWNEKDRLDKQIWSSWRSGMNDIFNKSSLIRELWAQECENEGYKAYYLKTRNAFFDNA